MAPTPGTSGVLQESLKAAKVDAAAQDATKDPKVRAFFAEQGAEPMDLGPDDLKKFMASEILKWSEVIGKMGIAPM